MSTLAFKRTCGRDDDSFTRTGDGDARTYLMERTLRHDLHLSDGFFVHQSDLHEEVGPLLQLLLQRLVLPIAGGDDDLLVAGGAGCRGCLGAREVRAVAPRSAS